MLTCSHAGCGPRPGCWGDQGVRFLRIGAPSTMSPTDRFVAPGVTLDPDRVHSNI